MDTEKLIAFVFLAINAIEKIAAAIPAVTQIISNLRTTITAMQDEKRDPSAEEWDAINAQIEEAMAMLKP